MAGKLAVVLGLMGVFALAAGVMMAAKPASEAVAAPVTKSAAKKQPIELGRVPWERDFARATAEAKRTGKPLLVLFDEVPGCATCREFGTGPLSHPLVIDAASEFVPVAVYNNVKGVDRQVLQRFNEPTWNNPVVRFMDASGKDLIPRRDGVWQTGPLLQRMAAALKAAKRPVPLYLQLAVAEYAPARPRTAAFAMYCYWTGEVSLGQIDGVIGTTIGYLHGREVVEVTYDESKVAYQTLVQRAQKMKCASTVFTRTDEQTPVAQRVVGAKAVKRTSAPVNTRTQQQYHLAHAPAYHYLPLTRLQATRINAAVATRQDASRFLSPAQRKLRGRIGTLLKRDPTAVAALKSLKPNRSAKGVIGYSHVLDAKLAELESKGN